MSLLGNYALTVVALSCMQVDSAPVHETQPDTGPWHFHARLATFQAITITAVNKCNNHVLALVISWNTIQHPDQV